MLLFRCRSPTEKHGTVFLHSTHLLLDFCCNKLADTGWSWAAVEQASTRADKSLTSANLQGIAQFEFS